MRARAGDLPRTMTQKILASHVANEAVPTGAATVRARVDQVVLTSAPRIASLLKRLGPKRLVPELPVVYLPAGATVEADVDVSVLVARGFSVARPGAGFACAVHLDRFASPARVVLTDSPRLSGLGAAGMLVFAADDEALLDALSTGSATVPIPCSVHVSISGRLRAFVSASDAAFDLFRSDIASVVEETSRRTGRRSVLEVTGPSVRFLSVPERAQLAFMATKLGALGAVFPADERMVAFLRDQRRSKAHRVLAEEPEAPYEASVGVDLGAVDPLLGTPSGQSRTVRELAKTKVSQVVVGGDSGAGYRELLTVAALLRSKRVPRNLDFIVAAPSRQTLEIVAAAGALSDLVATGARIIDPDPRVLTGEICPPPHAAASGEGLSLVSFVEDGLGLPGRYSAGPETLALAVATGEVGDPRAWKRAPRLTTPRTLPTDDVLLVRGKTRASE
jgi:aconitate hydratase